MTTGTRASFQRAIDRARELGTHRRVTDLGGGRYQVIGRRGDVYRVTVDQDGDYSCSCKAGQAGGPCHHQGGVFTKRFSQQAFGIAPGFAPAAAPAHETAAPSSRTGLGIGISTRWSEADDDQADYRAIYTAARA